MAQGEQGQAAPRKRVRKASAAAVPAVDTAGAERPVAVLGLQDGRVRAVIDAVRPSIDGGRFAVKRVAGEPVRIEADCFTDGHDALRVMLQWSAADEVMRREVEMAATGNDCWVAHFVPASPGRFAYRVVAWVDAFLTWRNEFARRDDPADILLAAQLGTGIIQGIAARAEAADAADAALLHRWAEAMSTCASPQEARTLGLDGDSARIALRHPDRALATTWPVDMPLVAERVRARFSSWYELFPRSASPVPGVHGHLRDVEARLDYVAAMGFDVLYLPPIHPIGVERRKGPNNTLAAGPSDPGSPWAIGSAVGGHTAIHPQLGTLEDFRRLVDSAAARGMEIALDLAYQCAPDHPYVGAHPEWFRRRPDGSVQYAENPPKKYQDIYPFNFECDDWRALWSELHRVIAFWIGHGVRIFRVDNPHTKAFGFWEWVIAEVRKDRPDVLFLAEAFTRPKVMHRLAKLGFSQSYTYFTWRNTRRELTAYFTELSSGEGNDYFLPNVWPNTPDILPEPLQVGGRPAFVARLVLAAGLSSSYGIYGPAFELMASEPREPGSEEYLDSEKYQLRHWNLQHPDSLCHLIARVNRIRRENPALQSNGGLRFLPTDNDSLIAWIKQDPEGRNQVLGVVNLDPVHVQSGWIEAGSDVLGPGTSDAFQVHDLLTDARFLWHGDRHFVSLDPATVPAHLLRVRRRLRREHDFDYFL